VCSYCKWSGHQESACFSKKREMQDKQAKRGGVDDNFGEFEMEQHPSVRMMRETVLQQGAKVTPGNPHESPFCDQNAYTITMDTTTTSHYLDREAGTHITMDSGAAIEFREHSGPVAILVDTAKKGEKFQATKVGTAGNMSSILVSNDLGDDVASIGRFDKDNCWWILFGDLECVVYDGDPWDHTKPPPNEIAKGYLGKDFMYRVPLGDLIKARERIRLAAINLPTERILGASATPTETLDLWHRRLAHHHPRGISKGISKGLIAGPSLSAAKSKQCGLCSACEKAKSQRCSFSDGRRAPRLESTSGSTLGLRSVKKTIRSAVIRPHGELYLQLFTDSDDKWRVVKFLTKKSDCLRTLQEFLLVDVQAEEMKVEKLHADGAPKIIGAASVALVAKPDGTLTYSPLYTPEMNSLAERGNQTAYNGGYAMLLASNLLSASGFLQWATRW
jgi:hypothetical protein